MYICIHTHTPLINYAVMFLPTCAECSLLIISHYYCVSTRVSSFLYIFCSINIVPMLFST